MRHHTFLKRLELLHQWQVFLPVLLESDSLETIDGAGWHAKDLSEHCVGDVGCVTWLSDDFSEPEFEEIIDLCLSELLHDFQICAQFINIAV